MSLIPAFELGFWNAWIFVLPNIIVVPAVFFLINKEAMIKINVPPPYSSTEKIVERGIDLLWFAFIIVYSFFLPLKLGTVWFYVGLLIYVTSSIIGYLGLVSFVTTSIDESITKGVYRISRNPMVFSQFLAIIGLGIACASWLFLLFAMVHIILWNILVSAEERFCLEKYGDSYREYMKRTPRWIGIPKSKNEK
jgi:protein-S-isoprenylcysteine O-methyltransferase Ste14